MYLPRDASGGRCRETFRPKLQDALTDLGVSGLIEIVPKAKGAKGFTVLSRRWVVERTFAWMGRCRRLAKDVERTVASSLAWVKAGGMPIHDAEERSVPEVALFFGNRRLMTFRTDSKADEFPPKQLAGEALGSLSRSVVKPPLLQITVEY